MKSRTSLLSSFLSAAAVPGPIGAPGIPHFYKIHKGSILFHERMTVPLSQILMVTESFQRMRLNHRDLEFAAVKDAVPPSA